MKDVFGTEIDEDLLARVKPELQPGEQLLWAGRARPRRSEGYLGYVTGGAIAAAFGLLSTVFLLGFFGVLGRRAMELDKIFGPFGVVLGGIGFLILFGMTCSLVGGWIDLRKRARQVYALTDRRALLWRPDPETKSIQVFTCTPAKVEDIHRVEFGDGHGNVVFKLAATVHLDCPKGFEGVADVCRVEELARRVLHRPEPSDPPDPSRTAWE